MDILRKMFKMTETKDIKDNESTKDEFRRPQWFEEESETDDELFDDRKFAFKVFTNPMELQKHFERQMQEVLKAVSEYEESDVKIDKDLKEEYMKPGFEGNIIKEFEKQIKMLDTDLDGEIYADQLHSLMQQFKPESNNGSIIAGNNHKSIMPQKKKLSDEEIIMGKIHGTIVDEESHPVRRRPQVPSIVPNATPFGGVFEGAYQGPKMFRQSVITKTVRKPDGTYETTKITQDSEGNKQTTVTRTINGKTETITTYNDGNKTINGQNSTNKSIDESSVQQQQQLTPSASPILSDPNITITKQGYCVPRNLW